MAGYVNICPQSVSSKQSDIHSALATLKHEILHSLVSQQKRLEYLYIYIYIEFLKLFARDFQLVFMLSL